MNRELRFRVAMSSDFDEILKLSKGIYDGHDYLPLRYQAWMNMGQVTRYAGFYWTEPCRLGCVLRCR